MTSRSAISLAAACVVGLALVPATVGAEPAAGEAPRPTYHWVADTTDDGPVFLRQVLPAAAVPVTGLATTRTIYLDHLGGTLAPGPTDSGAWTSSLVSRVTRVRGWTASPADWAATVACMTELFARFDVTITDLDPGATPHLTAMFGGAPADLGMTDKIGGVSPFNADCSVIERSIVFAFTDNLPRRPRAICEIMAQEIAHSYGLDHELVAADPMTYLSYAGDRAFQDVDAQCGETSPRPCGIAGITCRKTQSSVALLRARLGASGAATPALTASPDALGFGCASTRSPSIATLALVLAGLSRRPRSRSRHARAPRRSPPAGSGHRR